MIFIFGFRRRWSCSKATMLVLYETLTSNTRNTVTGGMLAVCDSPDSWVSYYSLLSIWSPKQHPLLSDYLFDRYSVHRRKKLTPSNLIFEITPLAEPCRTGGLVPGMREIKGSVLGRLPYYLVWQLPIALFSFLFFLLHSTLLIIAHIIVFVVVFFILLFCNCFLLLLSCSYFLYLLLYSFNCRISST